MPTKILVTGAAGFVGSAIAEKLAQNNNNSIVAVDNFLTGSTDKIPVSEHSNMRFIKANANDYKDLSSIFFANEFDYLSVIKGIDINLSFSLSMGTALK